MTEVLEAVDSSRSGLGRAIRISSNEYCTKFIIILLDKVGQLSKTMKEIIILSTSWQVG